LSRIIENINKSLNQFLSKTKKGEVTTFEINVPIKLDDKKNKELTSQYIHKPLSEWYPTTLINPEPYIKEYPSINPNTQERKDPKIFNNNIISTSTVVLNEQKGLLDENICSNVNSCSKNMINFKIDELNNKFGKIPVKYLKHSKLSVVCDLIYNEKKVKEKMNYVNNINFNRKLELSYKQIQFLTKTLYDTNLRVNNLVEIVEKNMPELLPIIVEQIEETKEVVEEIMPELSPIIVEQKEEFELV
jgi:hypothetical protein